MAATRRYASGHGVAGVVALPALVYGSAADHAPLDLAWLLAMTVLALLLARPRGLTRTRGPP
jgi:hypothetical protein